MATNRQDTLDPALLRPGRLDRKIEFPWPSRRERRLIFQTVTGKMNLGPDVDLEDCESSKLMWYWCSLWQGEETDLGWSADVSRPDRLSSAEIASICQAAGLQGMSRPETAQIITLADPHISMTFSCEEEPICDPAW